jgi:hypothetical protein
MERTLDFSDVTHYDFSLMGSEMVLKLFQGDIITRIHIGGGKAVSVVANALEPEPVTATVARIVQRKETTAPVRRKRVPLSRLTEDQVREIRANWEATVKACGTKNAAANQLSRVYDCSAKNIYAIIYRYSWTNI